MKEQQFIEEMRDTSATVQLKCQFDQAAKILDDMRRSRLFEMKDATKIVEMRLELESLVNRATGSGIEHGPAQP
ncbi:MAG: hypothetical protein WD942_02540 [Dehalococcoidia bacterium]